MSREELKKAILNIRPSILEEMDLMSLNDQELLAVYKANVTLDYYKVIMKQQMISVIMYINEDKYKKIDLFLMSFQDIRKLYLESRRITEEQFEQLVNDAVTDFKDQAISECNDTSIAYTIEEQIIATGVLTPEFLLTSEEMDQEITNKKISEILEEIAFLEADNDHSRELLNNSRTPLNYMARTEIMSDMSYNEREIAKLKNKLDELMGVSKPDSRIRK